VLGTREVHKDAAHQSRRHRERERTVCPAVRPNPVQERSSGSERQPTFQQKTGLEIVNFRPVLGSPFALANRRLQPLGHLTARILSIDDLTG
jgi:hypothetical protein